MFFEEETKDTHGNMDDYDLDIEQGESVSWDKLLDDKEDLDEPADLETEEQTDDEDIADKLLNMDDDSFDAFVIKQQQAVAENPDNSSDSNNEIDFDDFLLDDIDDEAEDALKKVVKNDLNSDNNFEPEVQQEETFEDDDDVFDFIQEDEEAEEVSVVEPIESQAPQSIQQEIAEINDLDDEEESPVQFLEQEEYKVKTAQAFSEENDEEDGFDPMQFADAEPDVPAIVTPNQNAVNNPEAQAAAGGAFAQNKAVNELKKQPPTTIILLLILLLGAGGYYGYTSFGDKLGLGGADTSMDISQDSSVATTPQNDAGADVGVVTAPPADVSDIPLPPSDIEASKPADAGQVTANAGADTQATKSVSKAIEQGRTKISKDKEQDKTKTNIQITTTGRQNPFVPVGNLNNIGFITNPNIDVLPPNETLSDPDPALDRLMSIKVSGILYDGVNSSAVINLAGVDYFVQKGDKIDSFTVVEITKTTVAIKEKNNIFSASIGQTFTSGNEIIKGQTQIQRQNNAIIRQYTTAADININSNNN